MLYNVLQMETYNQKGVQIVYYPVVLSGVDKLFGESNNKVIMRRFDTMAYYDLPDEGRNVGIMGIMGTDNFPIHISKLHYDFVSTYDSLGTSGIYPAYSPKIGDIIFSKYNHQFYRVNMVKFEEEIFLQGKHTWTLFLENFRDNHYLVSEEIRALNDDYIFDVICD
jgi:hypothetical protein